MAARREGAPQLLILVAGRVGALQMSFERIALLLRYDERREAAAPAFDLGDPIPLAGPCADERWCLGTERRRCGESGEDQRTDDCFHLIASLLRALEHGT